MAAWCSGCRTFRASSRASTGIVRYEPFESNVERITAIVEKPEPAAAPSNLAVVGRYILTPAIFYLEHGAPGAGGEIQLADAIAALLADQMVLACRFRGTRYDCGSKLGYPAGSLSASGARVHTEARLPQGISRGNSSIRNPSSPGSKTILRIWDGRCDSQCNRRAPRHHRS